MCLSGTVRTKQGGKQFERPCGLKPAASFFVTTLDSKNREYFERAFALAYYLHINKEVAFFVAEDALEGLESMLGLHERNRRPTRNLRGFLKSGERARPVRKTMTLSEPQMLQWLVYKNSEGWERQTE